MESVLIIAEAGVNHNGSLENAFKLIDAAVDAGADIVKFQTFKTDLLVSKSAKKAEYQVQNTGNTTESQWEMLSKLELSHESHLELLNYCKKKNIQFFSTAFDVDSLQYLRDLGFEMVKIPSGEITNLPYLRKAAKLFSKVILSTGMSKIGEIAEALQIFMEAGISKENICILHCNTDYPTAMEDVNLRAMLHIAKNFQTSVGYSDHTLGIEVPVAAVALGAKVIEKHFTLDKQMEGPDHAASLEPDELKAMVQAIRNIEKAVSGSGYKSPSSSELKNKNIARKSIVALCKIEKGTFFTAENLTVKRPGVGISPMQWDNVIGKIAKRDFEPDETIEL